MKAILRTLACALLGVAIASADVPRKPQIAVLDNENLLEGEVTRVDDGYRVRLASGGELTLPTGKIVAVVTDRKAAFHVVARRANRNDPDERLRLARWCLSHDLPDQGLEEAQAVLRAHPNFVPAKRLVAALESKRSAPAPSPIVPVTATSPAAESVTDVVATEYNTESFPLFASRVNAILLNMCASCHARPEVKAMRLTRVGGRSGVTKNLMAALPYVNPKEPATSSLLTKALTAHGSGTVAPFRTKSHPAFEALETWVHVARAPEGTTSPAEPPRKLPNLDINESLSAERAVPPLGEQFGKENPAAQTKKDRPNDPFDPAIFNGLGRVPK